MTTLQQFYTNEPMREEVHAFMIETLREIAADAAMKGDSTDGIHEAAYCVDSIFDKLEELYAVKKEAPATNSR